MNVAELVTELRERGVELWGESDGLHVRGTLSDAEREALRSEKAAVLRLLNQAGPGWGPASRRVAECEWMEMRRLGPLLGKPASLDGRAGILWGLTPLGAIFDTGVFLVTVDFKDVFPSGAKEEV
jgi:hypothetical protein